MTADLNVGADVEMIYELVHGREPAVACPKRVRINGTDVGLIQRGSLKIDHGDCQRPMTVTLTIFPRTIWLGAEVQD